MARTLILIAVFLNACSRFQRPVDAELACNLAPSVFEKNRIVTVRVNGLLVKDPEIQSNEGFEISSRGCIVVPPSAKRNFTVISGEYGGNIVLKHLSPGMNIIDLHQFSEDSVFLACGEVPGKDRMLLQFSDAPQGPTVYETKFGTKEKVKLNPLLCASVPRQPGRLLSGGQIIQNIYRPEGMLEVEEEAPVASLHGFLKVCDERGKQDPVVSAILEYLGTDSCTKALEGLPRLADSPPDFVGKGITDLSALEGIPFKSLDLSGNALSDLQALKHMNSLKKLFLQGNQLMFLDGNLPPHLETLNISDNPLGHLKDVEGLSALRHLVADNLDLEILLLPAGLSHISVCNSAINSCSRVAQRSLAVLNARGTDCIARLLSTSADQDLAGLGGSLEQLALDSTEFPELAWLRNFPRLSALVLTNGQARDISPVNDLRGLKYLDVSGNKSMAFASLKNDSLEVFIARNSGLTNLDFLSHSHCSNLDLSENHIEDFTPLTELNLKALNGDHNPVRQCPREQGPEALREFCKGIMQ